MFKNFRFVNATLISLAVAVGRIAATSSLTQGLVAFIIAFGAILSYEL